MYQPSNKAETYICLPDRRRYLFQQSRTILRPDECYVLNGELEEPMAIGEGEGHPEVLSAEFEVGMRREMKKRTANGCWA